MSNDRRIGRGSAGSTGGKSAPDPESLGTVLSRLFAARGYGRLQAGNELQDLWAEIAGPQIAAETRVMGLRNGVLSIGVNSSPLLSELAAFHSERLLEALQAKRGTAIKNLKFKRAPRSH
jgi:predicted nucleic acid-binding Zn ribbon protein